MELALRNATIIDGSGSARYPGDVGMEDGKIVAVGAVEGRAREEIDVGGAVVAPGFIDCHTHYDAQVMWDPMLSPSVYHGVTTVLAGNCGFTLAPLSGRKDDADYILAMLSRVEGMPLVSLEGAVTPDWTSFGEYLDRIDGRLAINAAFLVGHSTLRRTVMGARAVGQPASSRDLAAMVVLLRESLAAGAVGFSTTQGITHNDHNGAPVPSRWATDEEILTLSAVLRDFPGTWLGLLPSGGKNFTVREYEMATEMSLAAQRPLNWNSFLIDSQHKEMMESQLGLGPYAAARGAKVRGLVMAAPPKGIQNLRTGVALDQLQGWNEFLHLPDDQKITAMQDPDVRARLQRGADNTTSGLGALMKDFQNLFIESVGSERNARWAQRPLADYAAEVGLSPLDALFDLAVQEKLDITFSHLGRGRDDESWKLRSQVWQNEHCLVGASDAGAHLDMLDAFAVSTQLLGEGVRKRGLISLEEGVRLLTTAPADFFGLRGKGRLNPGSDADIVVFNPDTVGCAPAALRNDLPGGESRIYADAIGIEHVIVNGQPVARSNQPTGRRAGRILRSGRDTYTNELNS